MQYFTNACNAILLFPPRLNYKSQSNQAVVNCLVKEVQALNPIFLTQHIASRLTDIGLYTLGMFDVCMSMSRCCIPILLNMCRSTVVEAKGKGCSKDYQ